MYWYLVAVGIALTLVLWTGISSIAWTIGIALLGVLATFVLRLPWRWLAVVGRLAVWLGLVLAILLLLDALWPNLPMGLSEH